jgi:hypothetical protein
MMMTRLDRSRLRQRHRRNRQMFSLASLSTLRLYSPRLDTNCILQSESAGTFYVGCIPFCRTHRLGCCYLKAIDHS